MMMGIGMTFYRIQTRMNLGSQCQDPNSNSVGRKGVVFVVNENQIITCCVRQVSKLIVRLDYTQRGRCLSYLN